MSESNVDKSETAPAPGGSNTIEWDDFMRVDLRVGTIISVEEFPEARRPAYKLQVDFGDAIGIKNLAHRSPNSTIVILYWGAKCLP